MLPTGTIVSRFTAPEGWLILDGKTIGSPQSGATSRANYDTQDLYLYLWDTLDDALAPVSDGRGASALSDFLANKALTLPDARGRVIAGADGDSGVLDGGVIGASVGSQTHALSLVEIPNHQHSLNNSGTFDTGGATTSNAVGSDVSGSASDVDPAVTGQPHNNIQPTLVANWIIKL